MDHFEQGHELYLREPDLTLIEVYHRALPAWTNADREAFLMGYIAMRRQRDECEQEQLEHAPGSRTVNEDGWGD